MSQYKGIPNHSIDLDPLHTTATTANTTTNALPLRRSSNPLNIGLGLNSHQRRNSKLQNIDTAMANNNNNAANILSPNTPTRFKLSPSHRKSLSSNSPIIDTSTINANLNASITPTSLSFNNASMNSNNATIDEENDTYLGNNDGDDTESNSIDALKFKLKDLNSTNSNILIIVLSIMSWYFFSLSISIYNKWMFGPHLNFKFPIIITSFHQLLLFGLSSLALVLFPHFRLNNNKSINIKDEVNTNNTDTSTSDTLETSTTPVSYFMSVKEYLTTILPCAISTAGDIGLGNTSFLFISLSLYTMIKTSSLIFVLVWGVLFKLEKMNYRILSIVLIMTIGVTMMIYDQKDDHSIHEPTPEPTKQFKQFGQIMSDDDDDDIHNNLNRLRYRHDDDDNNMNKSHFIFIGCTLVLLSACMSGLRWALTQILLKRNKRTKNPILTIFYISPSMSCVLFIFGCIIEGIVNFFENSIWQEKGVLVTLGLLIIPGILAFCMTLSEFILLQYSSLLTLSIAGIFKELLTIFLSWLIFGDRLTLMNVIGLIITLADIIWYNTYRFQQYKENQVNKRALNQLQNQLQQPNDINEYQFSDNDYLEMDNLNENRQKSVI